MRTRRLAGAATLALASACSSYEDRPIVEREILRDLQAIRLEALKPVAAVGTAGATFDATDGLSQDEAVAVAVHLNPELRAARKERGIAEGELVAAGLLPNPQLQVTYVFLESFTKNLPTSGFEVGLAWSPPRPGEIGAKEARAQARIDEVRAQVAGLEWQLASEVRKAHLTLWAAEERLRVLDASLKLRERIREFIRARRELGDANRLDVNLVEIEYLDVLRERTAVANERDRARYELNRLLGLPPPAEYRLQGTGDPLAYRPLRVAPPALELIMLEHRPDLLAAKNEHEQAQQSLRLAYIRRIPWFWFGPAFTRDELEGKIQNRFGVTLGVELPIANLNQGEIAIGEAAREKLYQAFAAKVHQARAEVNEALRNIRAQERLIRIFQDSIKPALDENAELTEAGFTKGELNLVQLITTQDKVLKSRRESLDAQLEYWRAVYDLERALGERVSSGKE